MQSGKPVAVFRTHAWAPRVLIANSLLVPDWADWDTFRELEKAGLTMYGQMTAGSWIYIGTQGILQGTFETFAAVAEQRFGGTLRGRVCLTAGLGGMGGAQPLAITMNEGIALCVEVDPDRDRPARISDRLPRRAHRRPRRRPGARRGGERREGVPLVSASRATRQRSFPRSWTAATSPTSSRTRPPPTTALGGYVPAGYDPGRSGELARERPGALLREARVSMARHCAAMVACGSEARRSSTTATNVARGGEAGGFDGRLRLPRLRSCLHKAALLRG